MSDIDDLLIRDFDEDDFEPWCKDFEGHRSAHRFCVSHQESWCRICERMCQSCIDDPVCPECHCHLHEEHHDWDCSYADDD